MLTQNNDNSKLAVKVVYVFQCTKTSVIKIGISNKPSARLANIQTGYPYKLSLVRTIKTPNARSLEKILHKALSDFRLQGEWFHGDALERVKDYEKTEVAASVNKSIKKTSENIEEDIYSEIRKKHFLLGLRFQADPVHTILIESIRNMTDLQECRNLLADAKERVKYLDSLYGPDAITTHPDDIPF